MEVRHSHCGQKTGPYCALVSMVVDYVALGSKFFDCESNSWNNVNSLCLGWLQPINDGRFTTVVEANYNDICSVVPLAGCRTHLQVATITIGYHL